MGLAGAGAVAGDAGLVAVAAGPVMLCYAAPGWGAVVAGEMVVGTVAALGEGVWPGLWLERMVQFVSFILFACTGVIIGVGLAYSRWPGLRP